MFPLAGTTKSVAYILCLQSYPQLLPASGPDTWFWLLVLAGHLVYQRLQGLWLAAFFPTGS